MAAGLSTHPSSLSFPNSNLAGDNYILPILILRISDVIEQKLYKILHGLHGRHS